MGMDVYGLNGAYFRSTVWSWRPICAVMEAAGHNVPTGWYYNQGEGIDNHNECDGLADKIEQFLESYVGDNFRVNLTSNELLEEGRFVDQSKPNAISHYWTDREHIQEFVEFLRNCNGFEIY